MGTPGCPGGSGGVGAPGAVAAPGAAGIRGVGTSGPEVGAEDRRADVGEDLQQVSREQQGPGSGDGRAEGSAGGGSPRAGAGTRPRGRRDAPRRHAGRGRGGGQPPGAAGGRRSGRRGVGGLQGRAVGPGQRQLVQPLQRLGARGARAPPTSEDQPGEVSGFNS